MSEGDAVGARHWLLEQMDLAHVGLFYLALIMVTLAVEPATAQDVSSIVVPSGGLLAGLGLGWVARRRYEDGDHL